MLKALSSFGVSYKMILKDKIALIFTLIPIALGILLYGFLGQFYFSKLIDYGQGHIENYLSGGTLGQIAYYLLVAILTITLYFIVNWTFVLVLSIIASTFNDLLSSRLEKIYLGKPLPSLGESFSGLFNKVFKTLVNEIKKVFFILVLSVMAVILGYIPILAPLSMLLTVLLLAISYVDYSWSRHDIAFKECRKDIFSNVMSYAIGGLFFMVIVSIPLVNIIVPSLATSYFTILWIKTNEHRHQVTQ